MSGRIIALDIGQKRIGVARTDILQISVNPVNTYHVSEFWDELDALLKDGPIEKVIFGWPLHLSGQENKSTQRVQEYINGFKKRYPTIPTDIIDERYSSVAAQQAMVSSGMSKKKRRQKEQVDKIAAVIILQQYLEEY